MDLSQFSDEDVSALASGDMTKVSTPVLQSLAGGADWRIPQPLPDKEVPASFAAKSSFASTPQEQYGLLQKEYPGAIIGSAPSDLASPEELAKRMPGTPAAALRAPSRAYTTPTVLLPGEKQPRYLNTPGFSVNDIAEQAGALPQAAGVAAAGVAGLTGNAPVMGLVAGAGETARKEIGHRFLGVPRMQSDADYAKDVGSKAAVGFLASGIANKMGGIGNGGKSFLTGSDLSQDVKIPTPSNVMTGTEPDEKQGFLDTVGKIGSKILPESTPSPEYPEMLDIAKKAGLSEEDLPASIKFGADSDIARHERYLREGPEGQDLRKSFNATYGHIQDAAQNSINKIAGGDPVDAQDAGQLIRSSFKEAQDKLFDSLDLNYENVRKYSPGLQINRDANEEFQSTLDGLQKRITSSQNTGAGTRKAQMAGLQDYVDSARKIKSYPQAVQYLRDVGNDAFLSPQDFVRVGKVPPAQKELQDLYFATKDAVMKTVERDINPEFANEIESNNKIQSTFFKNRDLLGQGLASGDVAPERLYNSLLKNGDTLQVQALKDTLSPESFDKLRGSYLSSLLKKNADGDIGFASSLNNIQKNSVKLKNMFSPDELKEVSDYLRLGNNMGSPVLSSSGTGASNQYLQKALHPIETAKETIANKVGKSMYEHSVKKGLIK